MFFKIYKNHKVVVVLNENASTHGPIIIDTSRIMNWIPFSNIYFGSLPKPIHLVLIKFLNLLIGTVQITKDLNDFPLHLQLCFFGHKRRKRRILEVSAYGKFEIDYPANTLPHFMNLFV